MSASGMDRAHCFGAVPSRGMTFLGNHLLAITLCCAAALGLAVFLLRLAGSGGGRREVPRMGGWVLLILATAALGLLALALLTGRLGPDKLWFREPSFLLAGAALLSALVWWLRRPTPLGLRLGIPACALALAAAFTLLGRIDGRAAPLAMALPTLNTPAPELFYFDESGRRQTLAELQGRVVLLNFWATWCVPCRKEMPLLSKLQREHADEGLVVLYVSLEEPEVLTPFLASNHFEGVQARLDRAAPYYDAGKFYPLSYLITRDGRVAQRWSGRPREEWLSARVRELL